MNGIKEKIMLTGNGEIFPPAAFAVGIISLVLPPMINQNILISIIGILILVIVGGVVGYSRYFAPTIELTCMPKNESHSAKHQHHGEFRVKNGYAKLDTYVFIPGFKEKPSVRIDLNNSFQIAAWDYPDEVEFTDSYTSFECSNSDDFSFELELEGNEKDIGGGEFDLDFVDKSTDNKLESVTLVAIDPSDSD